MHNMHGWEFEYRIGTTLRKGFCEIYFDKDCNNQLFINFKHNSVDGSKYCHPRLPNDMRGVNSAALESVMNLVEHIYNNAYTDEETNTTYYRNFYIIKNGNKYEAHLRDTEDDPVIALRTLEQVKTYIFVHFK